MPILHTTKILGDLKVTGQTTSTVATGTAPFVIASTTTVPNLNADLLDGKHATDFYLATNPNSYISGITKAMIEAQLTGAITSHTHSYEAPISTGTTAQYWRGDKQWATLDKAAVGLGNVTNESKATMFTNPLFTGTTSIGSGSDTWTIDDTTTTDTLTFKKDGISIQLIKPSSSKIIAFTDSVPNVGTLKTDNNTAQTASASESFTTNISLHKIAKTGTYSDLIGKPTFATVATSGSYADLTNKPTIPATNIIPAITVANKLLVSTTTSGTSKWSDWSSAGFLKTDTSGVITVDTNSYLTNASTLDASKLSGTIPAEVIQTEWDNAYTHSIKTTGSVHGSTTLGENLLRLANTDTDDKFIRVNYYNNSVTLLNAANFRTSIGAGTGNGTVTSVSGTGTVSGITLTGTVTTSGSLTLGGSISGLTTSNLSASAGIVNGQLANSSITVGTTAISLGGSVTTIAGLTSVTSTTFVGALTGTASGNLANNSSINISLENSVISTGSNGYYRLGFVKKSGTGPVIAYNTDPLIFSTSSLALDASNIASTTLIERMRLSTAGDLTVTGKVSATSKSFLIDHPTKPGYKLQYGSLEGPENGVYVRGRLTNSNIIELPEYWTNLVDEDSITVTLTAIGKAQKLFVENIKNNKVYIKNSNRIDKNINCFYVVYGERKDVDKLEVEIPM